jgi:hypothetical protein
MMFLCWEPRRTKKKSTKKRHATTAGIIMFAPVLKMENEQVVIIGNKITVQILRDASKVKKTPYDFR